MRIVKRYAAWATAPSDQETRSAMVHMEPTSPACIAGVTFSDSWMRQKL